MAFETYEMRSDEHKTPYHAEEGDTREQLAAHMGYDQELQEKSGLISMIGFSCTIMITWEGMLFVYQYGLYDGGPLGSIIGYMFCWVG
ncbi:hypothetical protein LTR53_018343, partial [Teratosphaeriaceae sp. CCFEE 6253]